MPIPSSLLLLGVLSVAREEPPLTLQVVPEGTPGLDFASALQETLDRVGSGLPEGGVRIVLEGGRYPFTSRFELDARFAGTSERPIVIQAAEGAVVVFDGSLPLEASSFTPVTAPQERARLAASARDNVLVQTLEEGPATERLEQELVLGLVVDGQTYFPARFPDEGHAQLALETIAGEVSPPAVPVGKEGYGIRAGHPPYQEPGRRQGWLGSLADPRGARARFAERGDEMAGTWEQWQAELGHDNRRNRLTGFLDANWLQKSQALVGADAETRSIHLSQALAYGWAWKNRDKPFHVFGLLCELSRPGEWHFDPSTRRLFLYPPESFTEESSVSLPVADSFLRLNGTTHVTVAGLDVENVASGILYQIEGGSHNTIAGAVLRNSTARGVQVTGSDQQILGCDLVDLNHHVSLGGGYRGPGRIEAGRNRIENCHLYQLTFRHQRVGVSLSGVGNILRNNLIHNSLGQAVTIRGNDHLLERNELFNIGFEEGDGGAMYAGGDLTGYGVIYRHNFFHHLMHVPGKVERSAIHLDDLQAGATCVENLFYKSAGKGIFMNGGAGHTLRGNVFLAGYRGIYNVGHGSRENHDRQLAILADPEHDYRNTKENYVGRAEAVVGPNGWSGAPWGTRYPLFREVMEDAGVFGRMWPIRCHVEGNLYFDNARGDATIWSRVAPEARAKSTIEGDRVLDPGIFVDYEALDLRFRPDAEGLPEIPFAEIGLYLDPHRGAMPDKAHYRNTVRRYFDGVPCMPGTNLRIDTGQVVEEGPVRRL